LIVTAPLSCVVNIDDWPVEAAERMVAVPGFPSGVHAGQRSGVCQPAPQV
jgi:hypothetical protein